MKPSTHKFRPDPIRPSCCALCGRREDAHQKAEK